MRLAWCDRLALIWGLVVIGAILFMQQPGGFERSLQAENIGEWGNLIFRIILVPWLVLRIIDLLSGGPARRSGSTVVRWVRPGS